VYGPISLYSFNLAEDTYFLAGTVIERIDARTTLFWGTFEGLQEVNTLQLLSQGLAVRQ
jgi:hypothetical protein